MLFATKPKTKPSADKFMPAKQALWSVSKGWGLASHDSLPLSRRHRADEKHAHALFSCDAEAGCGAGGLGGG